MFQDILICGCYETIAHIPTSKTQGAFDHNFISAQHVTAIESQNSYGESTQDARVFMQSFMLVSVVIFTLLRNNDLWTYFNNVPNSKLGNHLATVIGR